MNKWLRNSAKMLGVTAFCFVVGSWIVADLLVAPAPSKVTWPAGLAYSPEDVTFPASDGINLKGWFSELRCQSLFYEGVALIYGAPLERTSRL